MPEKILVVDDSRELRTVLSAQLKKQGFEVGLAVDGQDAVNKAPTFKPDLIIMDLMMPRMDGFEATRQLRQLPQTRHIPIVMLSALGGEEDIVRGMEAGATDYIVKPFRAPEMSAKIKTHLRRSQYLRNQHDDDTVEVLREDDLSIRRIKETGQIVSTEFAGFQIIDKLGQGGTGTVYRAIEPIGLTPIALKVISPFVSQAPGFLNRFQRSSEISIRTRHPNIVRCYTVGEYQGIYFLTQELIEGPTLDRLLDRDGPFEQAHAARIMREMGEALAYLETENLIHRDIKPSNIFETTGSDGQPVAKLADFGLSRSILDMGRTTEGHVLGTANYLSPEQAMGELAIDSRSDLYSLAATVFHLVTGQPPFEGESFQQLVLQHVNRAPTSPLEIRPDMSPAFAGLLLRFLSKKPSDRAPSVAAALEMIRDVELEVTAGPRVDHSLQ